MASRAVLIAEISRLAPEHPRCFADRQAWLDYIEASAIDFVTRKGIGPIDRRKGEPTFNRRFNFCNNCTAMHALAMLKEDRCNPQHLTQLSTEQST